jgi:hypothetical protein
MFNVALRPCEATVSIIKKAHQPHTLTGFSRFAAAGALGCGTKVLTLNRLFQSAQQTTAHLSSNRPLRSSVFGYHGRAGPPNLEAKVAIRVPLATRTPSELHGRNANPLISSNSLRRIPLCPTRQLRRVSLAGSCRVVII